MQSYRGAKAMHSANSASNDFSRSAKQAWDEMPTYSEIRSSPAVTSAVENAQSGWQSLKKAVWGDGETNSMKRSTSGTPSVASTSQDTTWGRLVSSAVEASNKVSRAVNRDAGYESDEDGYKGTSHLSRIITEYHMSKARTIDDLPDWLRREQQAQNGGYTSGSRAWDSRPSAPARSQSAEQPSFSRSADTGGRGSGLRDIYDSAAATSSSQSHGRNTSSSTANDRLRQLRDQRQRSRLAEPSSTSAPSSRSTTPVGRRGDDFQAMEAGNYDARPRESQQRSRDPYAAGSREGYSDRRRQVYA